MNYVHIILPSHEHTCPRYVVEGDTRLGGDGKKRLLRVSVARPAGDKKCIHFGNE